MVDTLSALFDNLDKWRHLPSYQLERRADIFFSPYLPELIEARFGQAPAGVIPEFPVHIATIYPKAKGNLSFKIDYLVVFEGEASPLFIELKTDQSSRRTKQDWYLQRAVDVGLPKLLAGLRKIYRATAARAKYDVLLRELQSAGLIRLVPKAIFEVLVPDATPRLLYIQPHNDPEKPTLPFTEISKLLAAKPDPLSQRFARSLTEWAAVAA